MKTSALVIQANFCLTVQSFQPSKERSICHCKMQLRFYDAIKKSFFKGKFSFRA